MSSVQISGKPLHFRSRQFSPLPLIPQRNMPYARWYNLHPCCVSCERCLSRVVLLGVLLGWLMWKYPELVDDIIPWVALLIAWHLTWEYGLTTKPIRRMATVLGKKVKPLVAWPLAFVLGGLISLLYWRGINASLSKLAKAAERRASAKQQTSKENTPQEKLRQKRQPQTQPSRMVQPRVQLYP